ncbi:hypothetical protein THF5H11_140034 [Vibrio jasicida]|nr:hypothetical protein THF5H11_140034 [Vibrio jasicida]
MFALLALSYRFLVNPKRQRAAVDEYLIVLLPVVGCVTRFRHETTDLNECSRSERKLLI